MAAAQRAVREATWGLPLAFRHVAGPASAEGARGLLAASSVLEGVDRPADRRRDRAPQGQQGPARGVAPRCGATWGPEARGGRDSAGRVPAGGDRGLLRPLARRGALGRRGAAPARHPGLHAGAGQGRGRANGRDHQGPPGEPVPPGAAAERGANPHVDRPPNRGRGGDLEGREGARPAAHEARGPGRRRAWAGQGGAEGAVLRLPAPGWLHPRRGTAARGAPRVPGHVAGQGATDALAGRGGGPHQEVPGQGAPQKRACHAQRLDRPADRGRGRDGRGPLRPVALRTSRPPGPRLAGEARPGRPGRRGAAAEAEAVTPARVPSVCDMFAGLLRGYSKPK
mmetsp:Transcript_28351/g.90179  ORF Transcript_28351/g.90179 Transcript_28351/m.90179 type:complete len:340 (+) Transcript_28351:899-1918(+)